MTVNRFSPNIRPIQLRKDLLPIADLIDLCFADNMDAEGRDYLQHIRQLAHNFGGFLVEGTTPENSQLPFHGYLWEENGTIIGNLTLIQIRKLDKGAYLIANVAVHPEWRGRGIGTQLTQRAIAHVWENGGTKIYLQVRADNPSALHIYEELGFMETTRRTTWIWSGGKRIYSRKPVDIQIVKRKTEEWAQQKTWLREIYPWSLTWNLPFNMEHLQPGFWNRVGVILNGGNLKGWSVYKGREIIGSAVWESGAAGVDYLWLGPAPEWEDVFLRSILSYIPQNIPQPLRISINYPAGRGREAFLVSGLTEEHTLIWMAKTLPAPSLHSG